MFVLCRCYGNSTLWMRLELEDLQFQARLGYTVSQSLKNTQESKYIGFPSSQGIECLLTMHKVLSSVPRTRLK